MNSKIQLLAPTWVNKSRNSWQNRPPESIFVKLVCVRAKFLSDCALLRPVAHQAPLSMEFSRQEYWSGWPYPPPGDLPDPGIKLVSLMSHALAGGFFTNSTTREAPCYSTNCHLFSYRRSEQVLPRCAPLVCGFFWAKDKGDPMGSRETAVPPFTT